GETVPYFEACLTLFDDLPARKLALLGNEDLWNRLGNTNSQQLWEERLPLLLVRHGWTWLERQNVITENIGIAGTTGWYDYSARDPSLGFDFDQYQELKGVVNFDAAYIDWHWTDREFSGYLQQDFSARLETLQNNNTVDEIVVVTHFPCFRESIVATTDAQWVFGTAYAFNLTLGRIIAPKNKVTHVISGHVRRGGTWHVDFGEILLKARISVRTDRPDIVTLDL
ncbi:MAG: hypothetical protein ACFB51_01070, partial [Anaerolineae bacterium]